MVILITEISFPVDRFRRTCKTLKW